MRVDALGLSSSALSGGGVVLLKLTHIAHTLEDLNMISRQRDIALIHADQVLITLSWHLEDLDMASKWTLQLTDGWPVVMELEPWGSCCCCCCQSSRKYRLSEAKRSQAKPALQANLHAMLASTPYSSKVLLFS